MSLSLYLRLSDYTGKSLNRAGQYDSSINVGTTVDPNNAQIFEIMSYSNDVVQTLNIGSQSTGAGAGRITFNPFTISRMADAASPLLFQAAASGTPFKTVELFITNQAKAVTLKYVFKLVAVKTVAWTSSGNGGVIETLSFEYGGLLLTVNQQTPDGKIIPGTPLGWNRVKNIRDNDPVAIIQ